VARPLIVPFLLPLAFGDGTAPLIANWPLPARPAPAGDAAAVISSEMIATASARFGFRPGPAWLAAGELDFLTVDFGALLLTFDLAIALQI